MALHIPRGWGWVCAIAVVEVGLLGLQAAPVLLSAPAAEPDGGSVVAVAKAAQRASLQPILDFQPFGTVAVPVAAPEPVATDEPVAAAVTLVLQGILQREEDAASRAILGADGGASAIYAIGDALPGGGTLSAIKADRVVIDFGGKMQTLGFPEPELAQQSAVGGGDAAGTTADTETVSGADVLASEPKVKQPDLRHLIP